MTAAPLVSICMPCFNAAPWVGAALDSALAQTHAPIEIIVVDDGSTDETPAILDGYRAHGVKIIRQANAGHSTAANRALAEATGPYVKFLDADDLLHPKMVARQVAALAGRTDAVALGEWARFYTDPAEATFNPLPMYRTALPADWLTEELRGGKPMMQCAMFLIPRAILQRTGGWDERLSLINDFELFARVLLASGEIVHAPGARLYYRSGLAGSASRQKSRAAAESAVLSLTLGTAHLLAAEDSARARLAAANILRTFDHDFYPAYPDLRHRLAVRIAELGGSDLTPPGPPAFHRLRRLVGWRAARRIQLLAERFGLNRAARSNR